MSVPLAERMRPRTLDEFAGQASVVGEAGPLRALLAQGELPSLLFWGPPGVGKTTLARLLAAESGRQLTALSAVEAGVKDLRAAVAASAGEPPGIVFIDEVHRFNKAQQDALLPHVESGAILFMGATTENPSFSVNNALLSRVQVFVLDSLGEAELLRVLQRALADQRGYAGRAAVSAEALALLVAAADGDARRALLLLEQGVALAAGEELGAEAVRATLRNQPRRFDRQGDDFYDLISALHKSVRGSDVDAALYWLARMLDGGCDPLYLARRLIRIASEDIGNADPRALDVASAAAQSFERLGSPEGDLALAQATAFLASAPKSNAVYLAWQAACADVERHGSLPVPHKLRNAPSKLMDQLGYGAGYRYAHDDPDGIAWGEHYLPDKLQARIYYHPVNRGLEIKIADKLNRIRAARGKAPT